MTKHTGMARKRALAMAAPSRFPTESILRLLRTFSIVVLVLFAVLAGAAAFLTYRITSSHNDIENVTPASFLLSNFETVNFKDRSGAEHEGWLLPGLKGAPVIILCHGYNSNRSELLPLGTALRENHFNVYLFNFRPSRGQQPFSSLGVEEADQLLAALGVMTKQAKVNPRRLGLFGTTTGGYAAIVAAEQDSRVKALVADDVYDSPDQMFDAQMDRLLGGSSPFFRVLAKTEFHLLSPRSKAASLRENLRKLDQLPKLLISGLDTPALAAATEELYNLAPPPRRLLVLERSQAGLASEGEKKEYENQVLGFFLQNLPLRAD